MGIHYKIFSHCLDVRANKMFWLLGMVSTIKKIGSYIDIMCSFYVF
jgi:hypothetical protein